MFSGDKLFEMADLLGTDFGCMANLFEKNCKSMPFFGSLDSNVETGSTGSN